MFGGCSFCALTTIRKGRRFRSEKSVLKEVKAMRKQYAGFGYQRRGGPTAICTNGCQSEKPAGVPTIGCLHPTRCKHYGNLQTIHSFASQSSKYVWSQESIRFSIRYDLASLDDEFVEELAEHHVQGHVCCARTCFSNSAEIHEKARGNPLPRSSNASKTTANTGKEQPTIPYFLCAHTEQVQKVY